MELEKRQKLAVEIPADIAALFPIEGNLEGVIPRLPQVKILHPAALFEMPDETKPESFRGVILDQHSANAWWKDKIKPGEPAKTPDCFSRDGVRPDGESEEKQSEMCDVCALNQFGSDRDGGKGKDCKNMKRLHIVQKGAMLPRRVTVPPTSITSFELYMTALLDMGLPYACVMTEFSLGLISGGGNDYSEMHFLKVNVLERDEIVGIAGYIQEYKDAARMQDIQSDEYISDEEANDDPDIPF